MHDSRLARSVLPHVAKAAAQDPRELQPDCFGEAPDLVLRVVDQVAAGFGVLVLGKAVPNRPHASAHAIARVDDGDGSAARREVARRRQSRQSGAGHQHGNTIQRRSRHVLTVNGNRGRMR